MYGFRESDQIYGEMVVWISAGCQVNKIKNDGISVPKRPFSVYLCAKFCCCCYSCEMKLFHS